MTLLTLTHASFYLWQQVPECTPTNISIGLWQISRAHAHSGDGHTALLYAEHNIRHCKKEKPDGFFTAYAHESAARAYIILGNKEKAAAHIRLALKAVKTTAETKLAYFKQDMAELESLL